MGEIWCLRMLTNPEVAPVATTVLAIDDMAESVDANK